MTMFKEDNSSLNHKLYEAVVNRNTTDAVNLMDQGASLFATIVIENKKVNIFLTAMNFLCKKIINKALTEMLDSTPDHKDFARHPIENMENNQQMNIIQFAAVNSSLEVLKQICEYFLKYGGTEEELARIINKPFAIKNESGKYLQETLGTYLLNRISTLQLLDNRDATEFSFDDEEKGSDFYANWFRTKDKEFLKNHNKKNPLDFDWGGPVHTIRYLITKGLRVDLKNYAGHSLSARSRELAQCSLDEASWSKSVNPQYNWDRVVAWSLPPIYLKKGQDNISRVTAYASLKGLYDVGANIDLSACITFNYGPLVELIEEHEQKLHNASTKQQIPNRNTTITGLKQRMDNVEKNVNELNELPEKKKKDICKNLSNNPNALNLFNYLQNTIYTKMIGSILATQGFFTLKPTRRADKYIRAAISMIGFCTDGLPIAANLKSISAALQKKVQNMQALQDHNNVAGAIMNYDVGDVSVDVAAYITAKAMTMYAENIGSDLQIALKNAVEASIDQLREPNMSFVDQEHFFAFLCLNALLFLDPATEKLLTKEEEKGGAAYAAATASTNTSKSVVKYKPATVGELVLTRVFDGMLGPRARRAAYDAARNALFMLFGGVIRKRDELLRRMGNVGTGNNQASTNTSAYASSTGRTTTYGLGTHNYQSSSGASSTNNSAPKKNANKATTPNIGNNQSIFYSLPNFTNVRQSIYNTIRNPVKPLLHGFNVQQNIAKGLNQIANAGAINFVDQLQRFARDRCSV